MIKIVIITNSAWQAYNFRLELARKLKENGYQLIFFFPFDEKYRKIIEKEFCTVNIDMHADSINPLLEMKAFFSLYRGIRNSNPDVVLSFTIKPNIYGAIASYLCKTKSIANITGLGTIFISKTIVTRVAIPIYKLALFCSSYVFFQNNDDMQKFVSKRLIDAKKGVLIPGSGVDTERFSPIEGNINNCFKFTMVARVIRDKGVVEFIEAAKIIKQKYSNIEFELIGEIGVKNRTAISADYIKEVQNAGVIKYKNMVDDIRDELKSSSCIVLPSYREGCPRSILEASSMEIPVIVSNVSGCRDVVDDNITGFICNVKDSLNLSEKMENMINLDDKERVVMGKKGREKVLSQFNEKTVVGMYLTTIKKVLSKI